MRANTLGIAETSTVGAPDSAAPRPVGGESLILRFHLLWAALCGAG
jgi:hypothetical protein